MIFASAEEGFTICDPFMGSGSSAIAAIKNKCNFIGCDISFKAIDMSSIRISNFLNNGIDIYQLKPSFTKEQTVFWEEKSG